MTARRPRLHGLGIWTDRILFSLASLCLLFSVNYFGHRPEFRFRVDATRTRAWSLSEQTKALLTRVDSDEDGRTWSIAFVGVESDIAPRAWAQLNEILRRFDAGCSRIDVLKIDPTRPDSIPAYESFLLRLTAIEEEEIRAYDAALEMGAGAYRQLVSLAEHEAGALSLLLPRLGESHHARSACHLRLGQFETLAADGSQLLQAVADALSIDDRMPVAEYDRARRILATALEWWSDELHQAGSDFRSWSTDSEAGQSLQQYAGRAAASFQEQAIELAAAAHALAHLPGLELSRIGREIEAGQALVVLSPDRSLVIPGEQVLPLLQVQRGEGAVILDQRFRGEQAIAAAIHALMIDVMPMVVFMHASPGSLLQPREDGRDLSSAAALLNTVRYDVREWNVGQGLPPAPAPGQDAVWIGVPGIPQAGLEHDEGQEALVDALAALRDRGEALMLNLYPSLLPRYRREDPWAGLAAALGVKADTGRVIYELVPVAGGGREYQRGQAIRNWMPHHPVAAAVDGLQAFFILPIEVRPAGDGVHPPASCHVLASIAPDARRWREENWMTRIRAGQMVDRGPALETPVPLALAVDGYDGHPAGGHRAVVIGSGGWMMTGSLDRTMALGEGRVGLVNPGNPEFLLASVAWLGGVDDLIAPSPMSQQVARLEGIDVAAAMTWGLVGVIGLPLGIQLIGLLVFLSRRL